jgi:nucleoside-diphosphate-sugar epimerase
VRALARARAVAALPPTIERIEGGLADQGALVELLRGARAVVHAAATHTHHDAGEARRVNVEGTRRLVACAVAAGVERLVLISSAAVYGLLEDGGSRDESAPLAAQGIYATSKLEAEREAASFGAIAAARLTILRPSVLYGAGRALYGELLGGSRHSAWRIVLPGRQLVQPCQVDDLVSAILCSLADGEPGTRVFNVAGPDLLAVDDLQNRIATLGGVRLRRLRLPPVLAVPAAALYRWRGGLEPEAVAAMRARARGESVGGRLETRRIEERYGLVWTPLDAGLREMVAALPAKERAGSNDTLPRSDR